MPPHRLPSDLSQIDTGTSGSIGTISASSGAIIAWGTAVPSDATAGYRTGCLFIQTDGGAGTALYCNEGTLASCDFDAVSVA